MNYEHVSIHPTIEFAVKNLRDVISIKFRGVSEDVMRTLFSVTFSFLNNKNSPMVLGAVSCPAEVRLMLPFLPCEMANFQGWGVTHPIPP